MGRRLTGVKNRLSKEVCIDAAAAYPRSRGEQKEIYEIDPIQCGLSPLSRGTGLALILECRDVRFIPALAGNRPPSTSGQAVTSVYPRSRGEQSDAPAAGNLTSGLSPLSRGTDDLSGQTNVARRFIPARAGNRVALRHLGLIIAVYPRSRGEQKRKEFRPRFKTGLSPLARGTELTGISEILCSRFIPARAGNRLL